MANNMEATRRAQMAFVAGLAAGTEDYAKCCQVLTPRAGQLQLGSLAAGGLATEVTSATTSVAADNMASQIASINAQAWVLKHQTPWAELDWDLSLADQAGVKLANAARQNVNKQFFDGLEGLFAAAHPAAGAGVGEVGAAKSFIDTGLAFLQTEAGAGTQANLLTAAFSEAALDTALQTMQNYKDQRGLPINGGANGGLVLVVGPKNRKTAHEVVNSVLSGADMASNSIGPLIREVVTFPLTTDEDDWWLIDPMLSPAGIWMVEQPTVEVRSSDDGIFAIFVAKWQSAFYTRAYEYGIIGNNIV